MRVTVKLFATLRENRFDEKEIEFHDGTTAREIISAIGVPPTEVTLIFINGRHSSPETVLCRRGHARSFSSHWGRLKYTHVTAVRPPTSSCSGNNSQKKLAFFS